MYNFLSLLLYHIRVKSITANWDLVRLWKNYCFRALDSTAYCAIRRVAGYWQLTPAAKINTKQSCASTRFNCENPFDGVYMRHRRRVCCTPYNIFADGKRARSRVVVPGILRLYHRAGLSLYYGYCRCRTSNNLRRLDVAQ